MILEVVDLLTMKSWVWDDSGDPTKYVVGDVPEDLKAKAKKNTEKS